jgi:endonuclease/exonuclease/phosphatase family metal-dependent hydrolase
VAGPYSSGLLSRYPIRSAQTICLPKTGEHGRRAVLRAELAVGREIWVAYVAHLNGLGEAVRHREVAALLETVARFGNSLHVLMGDFNLQAVPQILAAGYADAWARATGDGEGGTWPVNYLFLPPSLQGRLVACRVPDDELARTASDHRPVLAEFQVGPFPKK